MERTLLLTGGAGFIGSAVIRLLIAESEWRVVNLDKLTYAANLANLASVERHPRYVFEHADICDRAAVNRIFETHRPDAVMHLAAESHVDRSIEAPLAFVETNVTGTATLLLAATQYWSTLDEVARRRFRFHHVSTDEVFGSLGATGVFDETTPYSPNSPYSASKAGADHLVRAWRHSFGLPVMVSNCSNNYGPFQHPEKLIPLIILNAIEGGALPVYGAGANVRDWLHVEDHARALRLVLERGAVGDTYLIGGRAERSNLSVVEAIADLVEARLGRLSDGRPRRALIRFVADRPGHDLRYAIDPALTEHALGWTRRYDFASGLEHTVGWYLENRDWWAPLRAVAAERRGLALMTRGTA